MDKSIDSQQTFFGPGTPDQPARSSLSPFGLGTQETLAYRQRLRGIFVVLGQSEWPRASANGTSVYRILGVLNPFGNPVTHV